MKITSKKLQETQLVLEQLIKNEIDDPMTDYTHVKNLTKLIQKIDKDRRELWNDEKFGVFEEIADKCLKFSSDDIPF